MWKKTSMLVLVFSLILMSSIAYATPGKQGSKKGHVSDRDACYNAVVELKQKAEKLKNEQERKKLWDDIMALKAKCEKMSEHDKSTDDYAHYNDSLIVLADKTALQIGYASGDSASRVSQAIKLPAKGSSGSTIKWTSGSPTYMSDSGQIITRPTAGQSAVTLVFFAAIQYGRAMDYKTFTITLDPNATETSRVAADKAALEIDFGGSDVAARVTVPFDKLPATGSHGSVITWQSSNTGIISHDGKTVNRPVRGSGDAVVVLTATIRAGSVADTKIFVLTVKAQFSDEERIAADKAELAIGYSSGNSASHVTDNLTLRTKGVYGSDIVWLSSNEAVISNTGVVKRPSRSTGDTSVSLTAIILSNGRAEYKVFTMTVKSL